MTEALVRSARPYLTRSGLIVVGAIMTLVAVVVFAQRTPGEWAAYVASLNVRPHGPDLGLLAAQPLTIQIHLTAALTALGIGIVLLIGVKGTGLHRILGWTWVVAMAATAISSLFIRQLNHWSFSFIHLLSGWVIIALPMAVWAIRRRKAAMHARLMTSLFVGGLLIAGLFAFIPGRLMWRLFFG